MTEDQRGLAQVSADIRAGKQGTPTPLVADWIDAALAALAQREQVIARLREWMAEYPNDKYTGAWWLAELDRLLLPAPPSRGDEETQG